MRLNFLTAAVFRYVWPGTLLVLAVGLVGGPVARAQDPGAAIKVLLERQAEDWNRGDLATFATGYKNSPDILFIGRTVEHGYAGMLAAYKAHFPTREAMGTLSFSELVAYPLDARFATATGHFHLERTAKGGGNSDGYFLLVLEKTPEGWRIVQDDSTALPAASAAATGAQH